MEIASGCLPPAARSPWSSQGAAAGRVNSATSSGVFVRAARRGLRVVETAGGRSRHGGGRAVALADGDNWTPISSSPPSATCPTSSGWRARPARGGVLEVDGRGRVPRAGRRRRRPHARTAACPGSPAGPARSSRHAPRQGALVRGARRLHRSFRYSWTEQFGLDVKMVGACAPQGEPAVLDGSLTSDRRSWPGPTRPHRRRSSPSTTPPRPRSSSGS